MNSVRISPKQWLWIIKLFELEISTRKIAQQIGLSYPTTLKAIQVIRQAIWHNVTPPDWMNGTVELDESYFGGKRKGKRGRGAANKIPVFGILERNGRVHVQAVKNVKAETLLNLTVKMVRRGSIVYTDKFKSYDALMFCGYRHVNIDHRKHFSNGKVYINGVEGFWSYAKERIIKFHGISKEWFPFYLKEMEFRYNHRNQSLFDLLVSYITKPVQNLL
ncbi:MAG: IS1595 family transposase [Candidatus Omnitrophica bacterium]|nr:IS1595 family transposase [Candidatus Omnitrophota bacterium]